MKGYSEVLRRGLGDSRQSLENFTDAAGSLGYGWFFDDHWIQGQWLLWSTSKLSSSLQKRTQFILLV